MNAEYFKVGRMVDIETEEGQTLRMYTVDSIDGSTVELFGYYGGLTVDLEKQTATIYPVNGEAAETFQLKSRSEMSKTDQVRLALREADDRTALRIGKTFRYGMSQEDRKQVARAAECLCHPDFYEQLGYDSIEEIEKGIAVLWRLTEDVDRWNA